MEPQKRRFGTLLYLAILFGGVILACSVISQVFNVSSKADYLLGKILVDVTAPVAVLTIVFARRWITLKTTLIEVVVLSLGLLLFVIWAKSQ